MALTPTIQVCLNSACDTLTLTETTGVYNASTNTGGYGAPNITTSDVETVLLTVIAPDDTEYEIDLTATDFPSSNDEFEYELDLADLGNRTSIEDGYWQFVYEVVDGATTYTATKNYMFYCESECCVAKLLAKVEPDECDCDTQNLKRIENYTKARTFLASLKNAASCFNLDKFDIIKGILTKLCRNADCKTCN